MLNISKRPVNIINPTPGTLIKPNPNDSIPKIKIDITTPNIEPEPP